MSRYEHGRILAVNETRLGSELVADHAAGVDSLTVEDPVDFDEDGGTLVINDQVIDYATYNDDTGEILLTTALLATAVEGDWVAVYDPLYQAPTVEKVAQVVLDGDDDNTDAIEATIALHLVDRLAEGIRGTTGESVRLELDGDEWRVVDVLGLPSQAGGGGSTLFYQDDHDVTAGGDQSITLTYEPILNSEHVYWNGLYQPGSEWTRSEKLLTVADPSGWIVVGDRFSVEYAYNPAAAAIGKQPAIDAPWWEGDPAQGCSNGYPLAASVDVYWQSYSSQADSIFARVMVNMQLLNPASKWEVLLYFALDDPGPMDTRADYESTLYGDDVSLTDVSAIDSWSGYRMESIGTLDATNNGTARAGIGLGFVQWGTSADVTVAHQYTQGLVDSTEIIGLLIRPYGTPYPPPAPAKFGVTNGSQCRFWIGKQVTATPDPADAGGVAEPYLLL